MATHVARRFVQAAEKGEDTRKMRAILEMTTKDDLLTWTDEHGLDLLHQCILCDNAEAADFLLKQGYFVRPYQPPLNLYLHLAALLGNRTLVTVLVQHRPDDFRVAEQPLLLPPGFCLPVRDSVPPPNTGSNAPTKPLDVLNGGGRTVPPPPSAPVASTPRRVMSPVKRNADLTSVTKTATPLPPNNSKKPSSSPTRQNDVISRTSATPRRPPTAERAGQGLGGDSAAVTKRNGKNASPSIDGLLTDGSKALLMTPLEVAARARNIDCVRCLLDVCVLKANPEAPNKGYLTLAAIANSPSALALVMKYTAYDKSSTEDYKAAVEVSVQRALPECLDLLLGNAPNSLDPKTLFKNINFFHVLYTFSATYGKGTYGRLPEATRVLIKRGHDVNAKTPPRTFPLYTLLTHSFCYHDYSFTQHYVTCLKLLLHSGADPNFDEVEFERRLLQQKGIKFVAGRNAYASALHCLLETVETYATSLASKALAVRFVEDCAEVLVRHKADVAKVGRIGDARSDLQGNVLHQYAKTCVTVGVDKAILQTILRFGADPDVKVKDKYAINVYFDKLFEKMSLCEVVDTNHHFQNDVNVMMDVMCFFMTSAHIREAAFLFKRAHSRATSNQVMHYLGRVLADFEERARHVPALKSLASRRLWALCGRRPDVVHSLPVKAELKTCILPLL